jgi:drug/metabolite transporter (DMT)-like permease
VALGFLAACISGLSVFVNGFAVKLFEDATAFTTSKNAVATAILVVVAVWTAKHDRTRLPPRPMNRRQWGQLGLLGLIGGSVPFVLFFEGLARASSTQAGFVHKTLVVWVAALAVPFLRERLSALHVTSIVLLVTGQIALAGDLTTFRFAEGEVMVLIATLLWAVEFVIAKRLLGSLSSTTVGAGRLGIGLAFLAGFLAVTGRLGALASLDAGQWGWVVLTGSLLAGFVGTWYAALARAYAIDVTAVLVFGAVVTAGLSGAFQGLSSATGGLGLVLIVAGAGAVVVAVTRRARLRVAS